MIRIAIAGYGNLGRGTENAVLAAEDLELVAVLTRRDPASVKGPQAPVLRLSDAESLKGKVDVIAVCAGSATDLPEMTPALARHFTVVDSFDTHADVPRHYAAVDAAAKAGGNLGLISCGWDPGLFSLMRVLGNSVLPEGADYTFWGRGVSQGHSDAIRRIDGVVDARQYTVPVPAAVEAVRRGDRPTLTTREKHTRECFVVAVPDADKERIEREIKTMPHYFDEYDTTVHFIDLETLRREHGGLPHGGFALRSGSTNFGREKQTMELRLTLDSNPGFTGSVLAACCRAAYRMVQRGETGCRTMLDVAPALLCPLSPEEQRARLL